MAEPPSSPPSADASAEDSLAWYKFQYEQLESELSEFQSSSKELEAELERDLDAADKRERALQERAETAGYEVEEWKVGCLFHPRMSMTDIRPAEIQGVQGRGQRGTECARTGNHHTSGLQQDNAAQATRH